MYLNKPIIISPKLLAHALPISIIILSLFYYWFAIMDRNIIFLYYHDMGLRVPDTSPFSFVTSSRYWMAGLVANGIVFTLYSLFIFVRCRFKNDYRPPIWWHTFLFCVPFIFVGTLIITMTMNHPVLPFKYSLKVLLATLIGLAIGLYSTKLSQKKLINIVLAGIDSFAIGFMINVSTWLENLNMMPNWRIELVLRIYGICLVLLLFTTLIYSWKKISIKVPDLFIFSLAVAYLLGTAFHYLCGTDGHFYITNSDNFFARNSLVQISIWLFALLLVFLIVKLRDRIIKIRDTNKYSN